MKTFTAVLIFLIFIPGFVFASDYEFTVCKAFINVEVGRDAIHMVSEDYDINFNGPHHGFVRSVPIDYSGTYSPGSPIPVDAILSDIRCSDPVADIFEQDGYCNIQIGSASSYVDGLKHYTLKYDYDIGDDGHEDYDEFYYNIVGGSWDCPVDDVSVRISVPFADSTEKDEIQKYWAFTDGQWGSTSFSGEKNCYVSGNMVVFEASVAHLEPGQSFTVRIQLPEGYWNSQARVAGRVSITSIVLSICISILTTFSICLLWFRKGRGRVPVMNVCYSAPDGLSPLLVGFAYDGVCNTRDVTSMIYYWADCSLISIGGDGDKEPFTISKKRNIPSNLPEAEIKLFNALFADSDTVCLKSDTPNTKFFKAVSSCKILASKYFSAEHRLHSAKTSVVSTLCSVASFIPLAVTCACIFNDFFVELGIIAFLSCGILLAVFRVLFGLSVSAKQRNKGYFVPLFFSIVFGIAFVSVLYFVSSLMAVRICGTVCAVCCVFSAFFSALFDTWTEYGMSLFERILGFKDFIEKVERDKLVKMIDSEPDFYYRVLSYAMVFGLEEKWASKFDGIAVPQPQWYTGAYVADAYFRHRFMRSMYHQMVSYSAPPVQVQNSPIRTGGSSFGSSGFSGGGHGGGGGHAW